MSTLTKEKNTAVTGLKIKRIFTKDIHNPYESFDYEYRSSIIRDPSGEVIYEINNVEVPKGWSQVATDILAQKYFRKTGVPQQDGSLGSEHSVKQVVHRMADCWKTWGLKYTYFASEEDAQVFYDEIVYTLLNQLAAPNSPQWFNTGLFNSYGIKGSSQGHYFVDPITEELKISESSYERPQTHACFILSVEDDLVNEGGIMDLILKEARIFKYGSGAGTNYSNIRGAYEKLSGGGYSSGLMSFLKVTDKAAGAIKSGGTTRRAAKMVCLDLDHPETEDLINWKFLEEKKVAALVAAGFSSDYEGEAYLTVSGQNVNNSIRIPNKFFSLLKENKEWEFKSRTTGETIKKVSSKHLWDQLANAAWQCGDPGVQFDTTINEWHTCPEGGKIKASNPCSEFMFLDNTGCNLASINLKKFWNNLTDEFDIDSFQHTCRIWSLVLEITNQMAQYPTKEIARLSYEYRPIGLGFANLGGLLMSIGKSYDSEEGRNFSAAITSLMSGTVYKTSAEIASAIGPFKHFSKNKKHMLKVLNNHRAAAYGNNKYVGLSIKPTGINEEFCPNNLLKAARKIWDEAIHLGEKDGFRNAQATVIAPTGTIGLLMDCDTTGIEPDFALVKFKKLSGGGYFKIVNTSVIDGLHRLGYSNAEIKDIEKHINGSASLEGVPFINYATLKAKGFTHQDITKLEGTLKSSFDIKFAFTPSFLGLECIERLSIKNPEKITEGYQLLKHIGFTDEQIAEANKKICGTMTVEGAPHIREEHLSIFDCANKCGPDGERYLLPEAHTKMMAAVQPFISGAISKTINFPNNATLEDIKKNLELTWQLGLKACTIYRDGSKMSQPLQSKSTNKEKDRELSIESLRELLTPEIVLEAAHKFISESKDTKFKRELSRVVQRKTLPNKRNGFTQKAKIGGQTVFLRTGEYDDGTLGEIFIDIFKEGASYRSLLNCFAISISIGLQYGVPLEEFVDKFSFTRFEPSGMVEGQPYIKSSTSLLDFIFRMLSWEYLQREDLLHVKPSQAMASKQEPNTKSKSLKFESSNLSDQPVVSELLSGQTQEYMESMMGDAPHCNICGHITIRNGTCYKCLNCGNSLGCS